MGGKSGRQGGGIKMSLIASSWAEHRDRELEEGVGELEEKGDEGGHWGEIKEG